MSSGSRKFLLFILLIIIATSVAYKYDYKGTRQYIERTIFNVTELDAILLNNKSVALREARIIFQTQASKGKFLDGSCLAEELVPGWSFDIVHSPLTEKDVLPENQCANYLSGKTQYLIEYDTIGNFIQIKERAKL